MPTVVPGARRPHRSSCESRSRFTWTPASSNASTSAAERVVPVTLDSFTATHISLARGVNLTGRTRVEPDGPQPTHEGEHLRVPLGLQREPESERDAGTLECLDQAGRLLLDPRQGVREDGRPVLTSDRLGVAAGHEQPAVAGLEPGSGTTRRAHVLG